MLSRIRYFFEDLGYWFSDRLPFRGGGGEESARKQKRRLRREAKAQRKLEKKNSKAAAKAAKQADKDTAKAGAGDAAAPSVAAATPAPPATEAAAQPAPPPDAPTEVLPPVEASKRRLRLPRRKPRDPAKPRRRLPRPGRPHIPRPGRPSARGLLVGGVVVLLIAALAVYLATGFEFGDDEEPAPAPRIVIEENAGGDPEPAREAPELGFPAFATKNTTRVSGAGPVADAAGVALATKPATGGVEGPPAVSLAAEEDWPSSIAAASLVAPPIGAPILLSGPDDVPELTLTALTALAPQGSPETDDSQLFAFGDVRTPEGLRTEDVTGGNPAEVAAAAAELRQRLTGKKPEHVVLVSSDRPEFAMPAAAWAARSGDPILFVQGDSVPTPTLDALEELEDVPVYVLGPEPVISNGVLDQVKDVTKSEPRRIGEDDAVSNSIAFARYGDGDFGWNITDPGHGLVIANATRPADAGAAAPLSASGKWGPLLLTDNADVLPAPLEGYLLDITPGYVDDPTRAVYNHAWLIGNDEAISVDVQAQVDELLELAEVQSGRGNDDTGPLPGQGQPESQPDTDDQP